MPVPLGGGMFKQDRWRYCLSPPGGSSDSLLPFDPDKKGESAQKEKE